MTGPSGGSGGAPASRRHGGRLQLLVISSDGVSEHLLPVSGAVSIGRSSTNDVCIDDPSMSRHHAVLHVGASLLLEDLGGANGTFLHHRPGGDRSGEPGSEATVEPQRISKQSIAIDVGAHVVLGTVLVTIRRVQPGAEAGADLGSAPPVEGDVVRCAPAMVALEEQARLAAQSRISVLLLGETGVGKEVIARRIHEMSPRADKAFLGLNCAALSETLLEAELFGHEKGAFTGAHQARAGLLESADGGTVFLDEVGEMPLSTQVKLLRVIEDRKVLRIGGRSAREIGVRFIAATNRDLDAEMARGTFRRDLFFRLNGIALTVPPLRDRTEEIAPLAKLFVERTSHELERTRIPSLSGEALAALSRHAWPGNVRELRNAIERAVVLCTGDTIGRQHLPPQLLIPVPARGRGAPSPANIAPAGGPEPSERDRLIAALDACAGNQTQAAAKLGITRRKLIALIEEHDLPRPRKRA